MKKNIINYIYVYIAIIHFVGTFFTDKLIFNFNSINMFNYCFCKVIVFFILLLFWKFIYNIFVKKDKNKIKYLKYFLIYIIPMIIALLFAWPGTWFGADVYNFYYLAVNANYLYYLNYLSSVFYIIGYMLFPCASGAIILQVILFGIVCSYIIKNLFDIYNSKIVYLMYIPFFMFHSVFYAMFANRPVMFGISYLLLISIFVIDKIKKNKLNTEKMILILLLTGIVSYWRSESIYLLLVTPLFIFLTYKVRFNFKNLIGILGLVIVSFIIISLPQRIYEYSNKSDVPSGRNLPMFEGPLAYMLSYDLKGDNLEEDLNNIDKVLDIELMKKYPSYTDTPAVWNEGGCIKEYTKDEYDLFIKSYINVIKNNIPLFIKTKILTFANASTLFIDNFTSKDLYSNNSEALFDRRDTKTLFGYNTRKNFYKILEGKFGDDQSTNIIYRVLGNFLIPMVFIGLLFIYSIIKRNWFLFFMTGMLIGHTCILFITAPASYFMYYFNVFMCGWFFGILFFIDKKCKKNNI